MFKKIAIILGTRPEIIKFSPIIRLLEKRKANYFILHTGQHYSYEMDKVFFEELELPQPKHNISVGSGVYGKQLGAMIRGIQQKLEEESPDLSLVLGDTNTVLAGALASYRLGIKIGHVESGLRSYDIMIEEINRVLAGIHAEYLFAPTETSKQNLLREDIPENNIYVTGNTVVDALFQNLEIANRKSDIMRRLGVEKEKYFVVTSHRPESVDDRRTLEGILNGLELVKKEFGLPIVFSMHPRTKKNIEKMNLKVPDGVAAIEPVGYLEFLQLMANAKLVLTDSGGIQEESCALKVPCVTLRENTERPETLEVGSNVLAGYDPEKIVESVRIMLKKERNWPNPFGDGKAAEKILRVLLGD